MKKGVLRNFTKFTENTCVRVSFLISCRPENTFFTEHLRTDASNSLGCFFQFLNQIFCLLPCILFRKGSKVMLSLFFISLDHHTNFSIKFLLFESVTSHLVSLLVSLVA